MGNFAVLETELAYTGLVTIMMKRQHSASENSQQKSYIMNGLIQFCSYIM